jgi:hypothetical protein
MMCQFTIETSPEDIVSDRDGHRRLTGGELQPVSKV